MSRSLADEAILTEIRATMARRQRTRRELADAIGMGRGALQRRLSGEVPFRVSELSAMARDLDVPLSTFFEAGTSTPATSAEAG